MSHLKREQLFSSVTSFPLQYRYPHQKDPVCASCSTRPLILSLNVAGSVKVETVLVMQDGNLREISKGCADERKT